MGSHHLQALQDIILLSSWVCFRGSDFPNPTKPTGTAQWEADAAKLMAALGVGEQPLPLLWAADFLTGPGDR
jgi:hypothetical protein